MPLNFSRATRTIDDQGASLSYSAPLQQRIRERIMRTGALGVAADDSHGAIARAAADGIAETASDPAAPNMLLLLREQWRPDRRTGTLQTVYLVGYRGDMYSIVFGGDGRPTAIKRLDRLEPAVLGPAPAPGRADPGPVARHAVPAERRLQRGVSRIAIGWHPAPGGRPG